jgi:hypothetical protein
MAMGFERFFLRLVEEPSFVHKLLQASQAIAGSHRVVYCHVPKGHQPGDRCRRSR